MEQSQGEQRLYELIGGDVPAGELERLTRVDALLRAAVRDEAGGPPAPVEETVELKLTFAELALVSKSLQAARTLGVLPAQDELLDDTIQAVGQALKGAV